MARVLRYWLKNILKVAPAGAAFTGPTFRLVMFDVGPGEAILLVEGKEAALVDGGAEDVPVNNKVANTLFDWIETNSLSLKFLIPSHPHEDHLNALPAFLRLLKTAGKLKGGTPFYHNGEQPSVFARNLLSLVKSLGLKPVVPAKGLVTALGPKAVVEVFMDGSTGHGAAYRSVWARVTYGDANFLLTGDVYMDYEKKLVKDKGAALKARVLKVTHHGSSGGTSKVFLSVVQPLVAIASTYRLPSGGPDPKHNIDLPTEGRLKQAHVRILETAVHGKMTLETDGVTQPNGVLLSVTTTK
ncbi:MAG: MBL fold metallo-hydrolase [Thaumarchaeota archaeon]|nr:MBL fold metallo-hydrolase [Nitrososphaerota archaeon]